MKKTLLSLLLAAFAGLLFAQKNPEPYEFKDVKRLTATPVKSQDMTGTCWAFSTASFLESEVQRLGKGEVNLSEMFVVRNIYRQKCENYVRRQGNARFSEGGLAHDLLNAVRAHGLVPESAYPGRKDPAKPYNHAQLEKDLKKMCNDFVALGNEGKLPANWLVDIDRALDAEFGPVPTKFVVGGTIYTPESYRDFLGINPDDYVNITSFTHHPYYTSFILEIPDNFANGTYYNLPLNEMMRCLNYSIQQGYSVDWDADVSNAGFSAESGLAIVPAKDWSAKTSTEQQNTFRFWEPEKEVSQDYRQELFDRQITQDDHLMHVTGILDEAHTGLYYVVKNSWGEISDLKGYVYVSEDYMRLNTLSFTVHKSALPKDVRQRLGIEPGEVKIEKQMGTSTLTPPAKNEPSKPSDAQPGSRVRPAGGGRTPAQSAKPAQSGTGKDE